MYVGDKVLLEALDQSESMDLSWAYDFSLVRKGYVASSDLRMICLYNINQSWLFIKGVITSRIENAQWTPVDMCHHFKRSIEIKW